MKNFLKKLFRELIFLGLTKKQLKDIQCDLYEDNRKNVIMYSFVIAGGMGLLLFLSLFVDILVSSRMSYVVIILATIVVLLSAFFFAKKIQSLTMICQYFLVAFLLAFGIVLGTAVKPTEASASFAVLIFVAPLLFTDLPWRINGISVLSIIAYVIAAKATQDPEMFSFNLSVILPYGLTNLLLTHYTSKMKIERILYAHDKKVMSEYDQLTGLPNRRSFDTDATALKENADENIIGICSFDVNHLKSINDTLGHKAGDELLIAASRAIASVVEKYGKCYRVGGDEFMAIIHGVYPSQDELIRMVNKEASFYHGPYDFKVSVSGGMTEGTGQNIKELVIEADKKMYQYKRDYYASVGIDRRQMNT